MIFAIALASNFKRPIYFKWIYQQLQQFTAVQFSSTYVIPCRDGVGDDYWNSACLVQCDLSLVQMQDLCKQWEQQAERKRPSHQISLDVDIIAWGQNLAEMRFIQKKLPLPLDVKIPLSELWQHDKLLYDDVQFETVDWVDD